MHGEDGPTDLAWNPSLCAWGSHSAPLDLSVTSGEILVPIPYGCLLKDEISRRKKTKLTFIVDHCGQGAVLTHRCCL